jgi:hypothetical protein
MKPQKKVFVLPISVGQKIWFEDEKSPYTIRACNKRYAICTKPFNPKKTVLYTIIDFKRQIRGTENLVFCMGFETDQQCREALKRLRKKDDDPNRTEISYRNRVALDIVKICN